MDIKTIVNLSSCCGGVGSDRPAFSGLSSRQAADFYSSHSHMAGQTDAYSRPSVAQVGLELHDFARNWTPVAFQAALINSALPRLPCKCYEANLSSCGS